MQTNGFAGFMIPEFLHYAMTIVQHANNWLLAGMHKNKANSIRYREQEKEKNYFLEISIHPTTIFCNR
jgi:hypothetical protein